MNDIIPSHIRQETGPGGLPVLHITNALGQAEVLLHGAHVLSFQPAGAAPVLWLSARSPYADGKAVRGGVPGCWPWFGPDPRAMHGFARYRSWKLAEAAQLADGRTRVILALTDDEATRAMWPHAFRLELAVTVGRELDLALTTTNTGDEPWSWRGALHTYFAVADVRRTVVEGLDGCASVDAPSTGGMTNVVQSGPVTFPAEVNRRYLESSRTLVLADGVRRIRVTKSGSSTTVVWNPAAERAAAMSESDIGDLWPGYVCIEAAVCGEGRVDLLPSCASTLRQTIAVE
ncbi:MAG: D-hexose-6-phosphate mutarotase [Kiritimatiellaeota bacterium]|nr:D-hexose-6-phosphate mutarotase [Kiritimatiellota bacterium]